MKNKPTFYFVFITIILLFNMSGIISFLLIMNSLKIAFFNIVVTNGKIAFIIFFLYYLPQNISFFFLYKLKKIGFLLFYITFFITLFLELSDIFFTTPTTLSKVTNSVVTFTKMWEFRFIKGVSIIFDILVFFVMEHYRKKYVGPLFKKNPILKEKNKD